MTSDGSSHERFALFVRAHSQDLVRTAYLLTGNTVDAEELVQDTLVKLYPKWSLVEAADSQVAYVRRAVTNNFLQLRRSPLRHERIFGQLPELPATDELAAIDDRDHAWRLLSGLPPRQRAAVVLRFFHDHTDAEIGVILGCRDGTVRSLISRGLATVRDGLQLDDPTTLLGERS